MHVVGLLAVAGTEPDRTHLWQTWGSTVLMPFLILDSLGAKGQVDPKALVCSRSGQQRIISGTRLPPHGGHRVVPLGCEVPSPPAPVWPPHGAWHGIGPGFPAAEHDSTRMPRESRAAASSCVIWSRGTIFDHCFPVWAVKPRRKVEKKVGCNHWLPTQANFV